MEYLILALSIMAGSYCGDKLNEYLNKRYSDKKVITIECPKEIDPKELQKLVTKELEKLAFNLDKEEESKSN